MIIDRFAGPGGWDEGLRLLGRADVVGIEWDATACETARANGHLRVQGDVAAIDPHEFVAEYLDGETPEGGIDSPPCQGFSPAGLRLGLGDTRAILTAVEMIGAGLDVAVVLASLRQQCADPRSALVLEPLRWALALRPEWLAWEQVTTVLPLWEACAGVLRAHGYSTWAATLRAEQYGVPQTRRRACLGASRVRDVAPPVPTHLRYHGRAPSKLDEGVLPWVSMAEALSWGCTDRPAYTVTGGGTSTGGAEPFGNGARKGLLLARESGKWQMGDVHSSKGTVRPIDAPAPTITASLDNGNFRRVPTAANQGDDAESMAWAERRPSPTIVGSFRPDVVAAPGCRRAGDGPRQKAKGSIRVTVTEAAILQSFPADYVWCGTQGKQFQQVGNAVPPLLAAAVLRSVGAAS